MKIGPVLHQQVIQLRWHFLACMGLIMVLPIEEGFVNLKDGAGFYSTGLTAGAFLLAPLLAGLIACGNVQADLDEKRYVFWRSKPVKVKTFMTLKFFIGLFLALVVIVSPVIFSYVSARICDVYERDKTLVVYFWNWTLIAVMTYSLCFLCNVLVRKTARAWLIGMAIACFLLLVPFILPLNFKDVVGDVFFVTSMVYLSVTVGTSLLAFILSLIAVARNWHLQTNLKGLLWTGAALIFLLMLLFTRQVANIKVLDEAEAPEMFTGFLDSAGGKILSPNYTDIEIQDNKIKLNPINVPLSKDCRDQIKKNWYPIVKREEGFRCQDYPQTFPVCSAVGNEIYSFAVEMYYREKEVGRKKVQSYEKLYVRMFQLTEGFHVPISTLDISDLLEANGYPALAMRPIDDKLIIFVNRSCVVAKITKEGELRLMDKKINQIKWHWVYDPVRDREFKIPLVPVEQVSIEDRITLSIDLNFRHARYDDNFEKTTLMDRHNGRISFCIVNENDIAKYNVIKWDKEYVYCRFSDARPFTILEQMFGGVNTWRQYFVKDGKFYFYSGFRLMIFDIRSEHIRKLGHFERYSENFEINDIEVLNDGDILLCIKSGRRLNADGSRSVMNTLYLLKNPE